MQIMKVGNMGLFSKKFVGPNKLSRTAPGFEQNLLAEIDEEPAAIDKNAVLDFMVEQSEEEYKKLIKVADVYRAADKKANEIMGKQTDGERVEVRIVPKPADDDFIETDTQKGKNGNANKTK